MATRDYAFVFRFFIQRHIVEQMDVDILFYPFFELIRTFKETSFSISPHWKLKTHCHFFFCTSQCQHDVLDPAIKGTLNVLSSCKKCPSVRRVALTSSIAAVLGASKSPTPADVIDESWFSDPEICMKSDRIRSSAVRCTACLGYHLSFYFLLNLCGFNCQVLQQIWYAVSKTLAEEAAWKFARENHIDMVVLNPGMVIGPMLQPSLNASLGLLLELINGVFHLLVLSFFKPTKLSCHDICVILAKGLLIQIQP